MSLKRTIVLEHDRIQRITERFAHQLHELYSEEKKIILLGIADRGYNLAGRIADHLGKITSQKVILGKITLNGDNLLKDEPKIDLDTSTFKNTTVVLIDDVLNTGKTLVYALKFLLNFPVKQITTVVLVDRFHRLFPIRADIVGLTLSTTLQDHISVSFGNKKDVVYLS